MLEISSKLRLQTFKSLPSVALLEVKLFSNQIMNNLEYKLERKVPLVSFDGEAAAKIVNCIVEIYYKYTR